MGKRTEEGDVREFLESYLWESWSRGWRKGYGWTSLNIMVELIELVIDSDFSFEKGSEASTCSIEQK